MEAALRTKPPARKKAKTSSSSAAVATTTATAADENTPTDAAFWKAQYHQLKELRETAPERHLKSYRSEVAEQEAAVRTMVASLRETLALDPASAAEASTQEMLGELEAKVSKQRDLVRRTSPPPLRQSQNRPPPPHETTPALPLASRRSHRSFIAPARPAPRLSRLRSRATSS